MVNIYFHINIVPPARSASLPRLTRIHPAENITISPSCCGTQHFCNAVPLVVAYLGIKPKRHAQLASVGI